MRFVRYTKSHSFHVCKTIRAPLRYVFNWCTDYRETDPQITGSKTKRKILVRNKHRVIYLASYKNRGKTRTAVDVVTLYPPKGWHLDFVGDDDDEVGDYMLTSLGPRRTRLDMWFTEHYKMPGAPSKAQDVKVTREVWEKYAAALERDFRRRGR